MRAPDPTGSGARRVSGPLGPPSSPQQERRGPAPLLVATAAAVVSLVALTVSLRTGSLGADVGRGAEFCEADGPVGLRQPANTLSNLGFVLAGLAIGWSAGLPRGRLARRGLATSYAVVVVLLGPGSMAMHATRSELGGRLDQLSMYLVAGFAAAYAAVRVAGWGVGAFAVLLAALVALCDTIGRAGSLPVVNNAGNAAFAVLLAVAVALEARIRRHVDRPGDLAWIGGALGAMAVAFATWTLSRTGAPLCDPHTWVQGHAVWHLLTAVAAYCLYRYWTSAHDPDPRRDRADQDGADQDGAVVRTAPVRTGRSRPCSRRRRRSSRRTRW